VSLFGRSGGDVGAVPGDGGGAGRSLIASFSFPNRREPRSYSVEEIVARLPFESRRVMNDLMLWPKSYIGSWKKIFDYKGFSSRNEYSRFLGVNFIVTLILLYLSFAKIFWCGFWLENYFSIYLIASIFPLVAISARRLNDAGESYIHILSRKSLNRPSQNQGEEPLASTLFLTENLPQFVWKSFPTWLWKNRGTWAAIFLLPIPLPPFFLPLGVLILLFSIFTAIALPIFFQLSMQLPNSFCRSPWV